MGIGDLAKKIFSTTIDDVLKNVGKKTGSTVAKSASQGVEEGSGFFATINQGFRNTPVWGAAFPVAFEVPALIEAFQNGDFGAQLGRSFCRVGMATLGGSIAMGYMPGTTGKGFFSLANLKSTGAGFALGMGGDWLGKKTGDAIFGKSIAEQQAEILQQQQQMQVAYAQQQQVQQASQMQQNEQIKNYIRTGSWGPPQPGMNFSSLQLAGSGYPMGSYQPGYPSPMYGQNPVRAF